MSLNTLCVLGCGTMGKAILSGLLQAREEGVSDLPGTLVACVKQVSSAEKLQDTFQDNVQVILQDNASGVQKADLVILGCKPQVALDLLADPKMQQVLTGKTIISICAGITIEQLQEAVPRSNHCIRAMPNTPCQIRCGMTIISHPHTFPPEALAPIIKIFSTLGRCRVLEDRHLNVITALSGSGPAFACVIMEALADGGVMMGLPRDVAVEVAAQALKGASSMVLETGAHPAALKDAVTTPAGCTIAGLLTMEDGKIRSTLARTIQEASRVAGSLGNGGLTGNKGLTTPASDDN
ncbi:pyrroline-5-carboxylate reductase [Piptocephalis cylindrospora]|uniref:Pyrroline-5-carboxylate reductase n=1 Tax=Piptocephalis cylindrospora TaxID=1907219 RepID=A0A4V1IYR6_9FUNG|nr:pyrroline-5-carboxylate reductase [Piptocephalis cylindrospora]|eukprot:RKP15489.1 pyrroline-5-carboxylate reductase [Piptocephalis cylindrospora]